MLTNYQSVDLTISGRSTGGSILGRRGYKSLLSLTILNESKFTRRRRLGAAPQQQQQQKQHPHCATATATLSLRMYAVSFLFSSTSPLILSVSLPVVDQPTLFKSPSQLRSTPARPTFARMCPPAFALRPPISLSDRPLAVRPLAPPHARPLHQPPAPPARPPVSPSARRPAPPPPTARTPVSSSACSFARVPTCLCLTIRRGAHTSADVRLLASPPVLLDIRLLARLLTRSRVSILTR